MSAALAIIPRPQDLDGCMSTWQEQDDFGVIRSTMSSGVSKVRRRFTDVKTTIKAQVRLDSTKLPSFRTWCADMKNGLYASYFKPPLAAEQAYRLTSPPVFIHENADSGYCLINLELERFSSWP